MPSTTLKKFSDELTKAMQAWSDLLDDVKAFKWPSSDDLQDVADGSAAWQELKSGIEELRQAAKEVEHFTKEIDDEIYALMVKMRSDDPTVLADEPLVFFLSNTVPERRYEIVYECQKLAVLAERAQAEGQYSPSPLWHASFDKIRKNVERGYKGCEEQLLEVTNNMQMDGPSPSPSAQGAASPTHAAHHTAAAEQHHHPEGHQPREGGDAAERGKAAAEKADDEADDKPADEKSAGKADGKPDDDDVKEDAGPVASVAAAAADAADNAEDAAAVSAPAASGDGDAWVDEDVLDGS